MMHGGDIYRNRIHTDFSVNLNPLPVRDSIFSAIKQGFKNSLVYPDLHQQSVRESLAAADGLDSSFVVAGNGASELIMAVTAAIAPGRATVICPAFSGYKRALSRIRGCEINSICLSEEEGFAFTEDTIKNIPADTELICIADPVSHTGKNIDDALTVKLLDYADANGIKVIIDGSFFYLSDKILSYDIRNTAALVKKYSGLYVIRSFTKLFALPGIRMGYLVSQPQNIEAVMAQLPEWNLSMPAQYCMEQCASELKDGEFVHDSVQFISRERRAFTEALRDAGLKVFDSDTVYFCFKSDTGLHKYMIENGVLIRDLNNEEGLGEGYYRIAVKQHEHNAMIVRLIKEYADI
ncbi:MAG: aminotransferase class I/II-fold pyridoxal phosphate-dependent enzyme [Lachnospiraceae bacterium]|nr:aminotransferase class I/II-fold pyridoxal phosphate-dependent enzyme [Lachnospiraceae bacterium]